MSDILTAKPGSKLYLLGNEAVVRGALENGISVAATYPGTPSSEIGDVFMDVAKDAGMYFEFSTNEKVALEVAAAAAASGLRSFVWMKHVGMNVASDSFMSIAYTKIRAGMVVLSADDPTMWSSQNEQDSRWYARLGNAPVLEPSNPQEMKDLMKYAFEISEIWFGRSRAHHDENLPHERYCYGRRSPCRQEEGRVCQGTLQVSPDARTGLRCAQEDH